MDERNEPIRVGIVLRENDLQAWQGRLSELAENIVASGVDHATVGDHVSFAGGHGADGLIQATALLAAHAGLHVQTGVYLLALRHPATVARQLATIDLLAPGRFTFGVGVGGDDPRELELCGIDPRTRGARTTEALECVMRFMTGEEITFHGRFFSVAAAAIRPAPLSPIPVLVGGRSNAALVRAARFGAGWLALWVSPVRFREAISMISETATDAGREHHSWGHTLQLWAGFDSSREKAARRVRQTMETAYSLPFDRFERYTPCGRPDQVAAALQPFLEVGCRRFNVVPEAPSLEEAIAAIGEVKRCLAAHV